MEFSCAAAIAAFLQIVIANCIEQSRVWSTAPTLANWIFLKALLHIFLDICIYTVRSMHLPYICQIVAETLVAILLKKFCLLVVWCNIEKICCKLCKSLLLVNGVTPRFYYAWENYILGTVTTSTSVAILLFVRLVTDDSYFLGKWCLRMYRKINSNVMGSWSKLRSLMVANKCANSDVFARPDAAECCDMNSDILYQARRSNNNRRNRSRRRARRSRNRRR